MISVLNFKKFDKGAINGFFDLRYHGLTIKSCRLMHGKNGLWFSFPQIKGKSDDGSTQYFDLMFLTAPEREYIRALILAELESQGLIERSQGGAKRSAPTPRLASVEPTGEEHGEYYSGSDEEIPF